MGITEQARSATAWAIKYGVPRYGLWASARGGDLVSKIAVDPRLRENPFPAYDEVRARGPVVSGRIIHATASYEVASELLRGGQFLACPAAAPTARLQRLLDRIADPDKATPVDPPSLLAANGVDHARMRKLAGRAFTPRAINSLAARIHDLAHELLDEVAGTFDLIETYATRLPVTVIAEILGVPESGRSQFVTWVHEGALSLEPGLSWRDYRRTYAAIQEAHAWLNDHIAWVRRNPSDNLLSQMIQAVDGSDRLTDTELRATALLVLGAGFETTVNLIGNAVALLLRHPSQLARLKTEPAGWANAVEEVLRYDSPVQVTVRVAGSDTQVASTPLRAGSMVLVMLGGANRDPGHFTDPHRFDVGRANAREHLAFSAGAHFCLGAHLARIEGAIALQALFSRFPLLALDGAPVRRATRVLRGYQGMAVVAGAARSRAGAARSRESRPVQVSAEGAGGDLPR